MEDMNEMVKVVDKCVGEKVHHAIEPFKERLLQLKRTVQS